VVTLEALVGAITELHKFGFHATYTVALDSMIAGNRSGDTHAARNVNTEDNGDILRLSFGLFVNYLSCCLQYIVDGLGLGTLFWLDIDLVLSETELAAPNLPGFLDFLCLRVFVENGLACLAEDGVASGHLTGVLQAAHIDQEYIGIDLLLVLRLFLLSHYLFTLCLIILHRHRHCGRWHRYWVLLLLSTTAKYVR